LPTRTLRSDDAVDLQLHTIYSDGQWQPEQLFSYLQSEGFRAVSITDHDTLEHVEELVTQGGAYGLLVIPGIEVTTTWRGLSAHLLCYVPRFVGDALAALVKRTEREQLANTQAVYDELHHRGYAFPRQADMLREQGSQIRRPIDNARLLESHDYAETQDQALAMIRDAGYRQILAPLEDAVAAAHASGAITVLGHPGRSGGEISRFDPPLLEELIQVVPLDGIEVWYPLHTEEQVAAYATFAQEHSLLTSAGSDSHGPQQRLPIKYPASHCAQLLERVGVAVEHP
jgi:3',5'-nucleoside bisphosphate phosphatase